VPEAWRAPLRAALDVVREQAATAFTVAGAEYFSDPWAARDGYGDLLADPASREGFCGKHLLAGVDPVVAFELLESQRHALAMYTSCAWFFHDLAGLETVLVMRHAARCMDLIRHATGQRSDLDAVFAHLATAQSNDPNEGSGVDIWRRWVDPVRDAEAEMGTVTPSPQVAMGLVVTDAVHRAVQSRNHGDIDRARDVVRLAGHGPVLEAAQEEIYDILLAQGDHTGLESLGFDLGLAVGQLGLDRLVDSTTSAVA
jgi:Domain of unknown function (DUF3536)